MPTIFNYSSRDIIIGLSKVFKLDINIDLNKILDIIKTKQYTIILATGGDETTNYSTKIEVPQIIHNIIIYKTDTEVKNKCIVDNTYLVHKYPILSRNTFKLPVHIKESHIYTYAFSNGKIITIQPLHRLAHTDGTLSKAFNTSDLLDDKCPPERRMTLAGCCPTTQFACKEFHLCCENGFEECTPLEAKCRKTCSQESKALKSAHRCDTLSGGACCKSEKYCVSTIKATSLLKKHQTPDSPNGYGCSPCDKSGDYPNFCQTIFENILPYGKWAYCAKNDGICKKLSNKLFTDSMLEAVFLAALLEAAALIIEVGALTGGAAVFGAAASLYGVMTVSAAAAPSLAILNQYINDLKKEGSGYKLAPGWNTGLENMDLNCETSLKKLNFIGKNKKPPCDSPLPDWGRNLETCALYNLSMQMACQNVLQTSSGCVTCHDFCQLIHPDYDGLDVSGILTSQCRNNPADPSCAYVCHACKCIYNNISELCIVRANDPSVTPLPPDHSCCDPTSNKSYDINSQGCCLTSNGYKIYDKSKYICCDGSIVPNSYACCKNTYLHKNNTISIETSIPNLEGLDESTEFFYDPKITKCCTRTPLNYTPNKEAIDASSVMCDIRDYCGHDMSGNQRCRREGLIPGKELSFNAQCPTALTDGPHTPMIDSSTCTSIKQEDLNKLTTEKFKYMSCDNIYISYQDTYLGQVTSFCANNDDPRRPSNYPCRDTSAFCQRYAKNSNSWTIAVPLLPLNTPAPTPTNEISDCRNENEYCDINISSEDDTTYDPKGDCCDGYECRSRQGMYITPLDPWVCTAPTPPTPPNPYKPSYICPPYC